MKIAIDAAVPTLGGMIRSFHGLAHALGRLEGPEEYVLILHEKNMEELRPARNQRVVIAADNRSRLEAASACDIVHFFLLPLEARRPTVFTVHDLLHLNHSNIFSPRELERRTRMIADGINRADRVTCPSEWVREDVFMRYGVDAKAVRWGPPTEFDDVVEEERAPFCLYPAADWEHKNHRRLFDALPAGLDLVCTASPDDPRIKRLGWIPAPRLRGLYRRCEFVIFPSLHEGAGLPLLEAWFDNAPVACSNDTGLAEYAGDAALLFDPLSTSAIADAILRMHSDPDLRNDLRTRGRERLLEFSWERAALAYREIYRNVLL